VVLPLPLAPTIAVILLCGIVVVTLVMTNGEKPPGYLNETLLKYKVISFMRIFVTTLCESFSGYIWAQPINPVGIV
jgi:hypothetical protein